MREQSFVTGGELLACLHSKSSVEIDGWYVSMDDGDVWLTNPYGLDCGLVEATEEGCQSALDLIANDTHEREWF